MKALVLVLIPLLAIGCGKKDSSDTPEAVAKAFAEAMSQGDTTAAAKLFDYASAARLENPDWDTFPAGQRNLIIGKLQEDKASQLSAAFTSGATYSVEPAGGEGSYSLLINGTPSAKLQLAKVGESWKVSGIQ